MINLYKKYLPYNAQPVRLPIRPTADSNNFVCHCKNNNISMKIMEKRVLKILLFRCAHLKT